MGIAKNSLGATIFLLIIFSYFCQAACGTVYGVVPFVSKRSLGIVSGFVGAGGNVGAVVTQQAFFKDKFSTSTGFIYMGILIMAVTLLAVTLFFPMWGGAQLTCVIIAQLAACHVSALHADQPAFVW